MDERRSRTVPAPLRTMHLSLIAVWLGTALVSAIEHRGLSVQVLADAGIHDAGWQTFLIWSGLLASITAPSPSLMPPARGPACA